MGTKVFKTLIHYNIYFILLIIIVLKFPSLHQTTFNLMNEEFLRHYKL